MNSKNGIKVLQIIKGLDIGGNSGGSEYFGLRLARQLRHAGLSVSLCAYYHYNTPVESAWVERLQNEGIQVFFANHDPKTNLWEGYRNLSRFLKQNPLDLIHSHFQVGTLTSIMVKITRKARHIVRTAHIQVEFGDGLVARVARVVFVYGLYPFFVDKEVGVSQGIVDGLNNRLMGRAAGKRVLCIHNALSEMPEKSAINNPLAPYIESAAVSPWIITMIGVLIPRKNFETTIRAMPIILKEIPNARLVIVGQGPEGARLKRLAVELNVKDQVLILGQRSDIFDILTNTNLFVLPSVLEGLSTVILEAMQSGVPVVASDIPSNRELVEPGVNGWLFRPRDARALALAVIDAHHHPQQAQMYVRRSFAHLEKFRMPGIAEQYIQLYQNLLVSGTP